MASRDIDISSTVINSTTPTTLDLSSNTHVPVMDEQQTEISVRKKEYSIVGDALYATVSSEEAPQWLTSIIDSTIDLRLVNSLSDLSVANSSILTALDAVVVAENQIGRAHV